MLAWIRRGGLLPREVTADAMSLVTAPGVTGRGGEVMVTAPWAPNNAPTVLVVNVAPLGVAIDPEIDPDGMALTGLLTPAATGATLLAVLTVFNVCVMPPA